MRWKRSRLRIPEAVILTRYESAKMKQFGKRRMKRQLWSSRVLQAAEWNGTQKVALLLGLNNFCVDYTNKGHWIHSNSIVWFIERKGSPLPSSSSSSPWTSANPPKLSFTVDVTNWGQILHSIQLNDVFILHGIAHGKSDGSPYQIASIGGRSNSVFWECCSQFRSCQLGGTQIHPQQ